MTFRSTRSLGHLASSLLFSFSSVVAAGHACQPLTQLRDVDVDDRHFEKLPPLPLPSSTPNRTSSLHHVKYFPSSHLVSPPHYSSHHPTTCRPSSLLIPLLLISLLLILVTHHHHHHHQSPIMLSILPIALQCDVLIPFLTPTSFPFLLPVFYISSNFVCLFCYVLTASRYLLHKPFFCSIYISPKKLSSIPLHINPSLFLF